jgi:hypothetical protein
VALEESMSRQAPRRREASEGETRRATLVREMVRGAILPHLLDRKDRGVFDRGPNVVRFPGGDR